MRKIGVILLVLSITFSFCGCNTSDRMIYVDNNKVRLSEPDHTPVITVRTLLNEINFTLEDDSFCDKLSTIINSKTADDKFCYCRGDYQIIIDGIYLLYLHPDKIVVYTDLETYTGFTVDCSEAETKILYDIIEAEIAQQQIAD